jgi:alpha-1,6-mannosyltransferase
MDGSLGSAILFLKGTVVLASLLTGALIWFILGRVRPENRLPGTLAYLWNPMIIVELAGEGHNDALMTVFVVAALALAIRGRHLLSSAALVMGTLTKFLPLIYLPALLAHRYRQGTFHSVRARRNDFFGFVLWVGGLASVLSVVFFFPFWQGWATLSGVIESSQRDFYPSLSGLLVDVISPVRDPLWHRMPMPTQASQLLVSALLVPIFLAVVGKQVTRIRDNASLISGTIRIALTYLLVAAPAYWPWYATLPFALLALEPNGKLGSLMVALTFCSRLAAPVDAIRGNYFIQWPTEVWLATWLGILLPLAIFLYLLYLESTHQRTKLLQERSQEDGRLRSVPTP